jgi:acyl carrier protein
MFASSATGVARQKDNNRTGPPMLTGKEVEFVIFRAMENLNAELGVERAVRVSLDTELFGIKAEIDSLSLVSLIVDIESSLNADYSCEVSLTDDRAMMREISPFTNVIALRDYIVELLAERAR